MGVREEEILNKLKAEAKRFELPVEDFVWDGIQMGIIEEKPKKRGLFWWMFGGGVFILTIIIFYWFNFNLESKESLVQDFSEELIAVNKVNLLNMSTSFERQQNWSEKKLTESAGKVINRMKRKRFYAHDSNLSVLFERDDFKSNKDDVEVPVSINLVLLKDEDGLGSLKQRSPKATIFEKNYIPHLINISPKLITLSTAYKGLAITKYNAARNPITKKKSRRKFSLLFHAGLGESFRMLNSGIHHDLITHKNDHESYGNCFEVGLDAQFRISERLIGRTGVGYKFYSDKYDFQHDLITHTTRNDYQYFQIPFLLGVKALERSKSKLFILGGVKVNFLFSAQSSWVDLAALAPVAHSNNAINSPFRNVTGAINLGLDYNYELTDNMQFHLIPSAETFVNSVYKRNTEINQRLFSFNLDLGISYTFK